MADSKFNIQLTAIFNKEQIKQRLKILDNKVSLVVAVKFNKKQVQDALKVALGGEATLAKGRTEKAEGTKAVSTDIADDRLVSTTKQFNDQKELVKEIKSGYDSVGDSIREVYDAQGNLISATKKEGELAYKNTQTYDKLKDKLSDLANRNIISSKDFERFNVELDKANKNTDELGKKQAFDKIGMSIRNATKSGQGFFSSIKSLVPKLAQLNIGGMVVKAGMALVKKAIESVIASIKELDKSFTEIQMVTKQTAQETAQLRNSYIDLARSMGATVKEVTDGANDWLRAGMSIEETNEALEASMVLSKVGMVDSAEATKILISAMRGYKLEASELMTIVDKLSAVDVAASVSTENLGLAIQKGSASARLAGLSLDEYLGMVAAVAETTQESGDIIGNSFKRIFARAQRVKLGETVDEEGEDISNYFSDVDQAMASIGINWAKETDNLNDLGAGLDTLAKRWQTLDTAQKKQIANAVAGAHQMDRFIVLMDNYDRAVELAGVSTNSAGSAMEKYDVYLQSLEARMNSAKAAWEEVGAAFLDSGLVDVLADFVVEFSDLLALLIEFTVRFLKGSTIMDILNGVITILNVILDAVNKLFEYMNWGLEKLGSFLGTRGFFQRVREWLKLDGSTASEKQAEKTKKVKEATNEATKSYDKYAEAVNEAKKAISGFTKELDTRLTAIEKEKERLDEERQIQEKLLSIEKAREELARAKQSRVLGFRIGKGFVEIEDSEAIQEAQESLNSAIKDYDDTILDINLEKVKQMQEILNAPTENLDSWRDYLDSFSKLLGTEFEDIYKQFVEFMTKLENATKEDAQTDYEKVVGVISSKGLSNEDYDKWEEIFEAEGVGGSWANLSDSEKRELKMSSVIDNILGAIGDRQYATGSTSTSGGLSMVGENGPELRVLNRGDGIIPSSITKNLWEMGKNPYKFTDKSGGSNITFTGNLSFPNVTNERDAQAFIDKVMQISVPRI